MRALRSLFVPLAALFALVGCVDDETRAVTTSPVARAEPAWTVVVYGNADNDLSDALEGQISAMAHASLGGSVDVVVVLDRNDRAHPDRGQGTAWLSVEGDGKLPTVIRREPEQSFDDPRVLEDVVGRAFREHPSRRRALVLWGHGAGWSRGYGGDSHDGALLAGTTSPMPTEAVADAIAAGLAAAGGPSKLDLLGFDACLMGGVETAYAMRDVASVLVASAEIDYGAGWDYTGFLSQLAATPDADVAELARAEVALWDARHRGTVDDRVLRAQVAVDLSKMDAVASAVGELSRAAAPEASSVGVLFAKAAFFSTPAYGGDVGGVRTPTLHDLGQLAATLASRPELAVIHDRAVAVGAALDEAVLARALGDLRATQGGLHVGLPSDDNPGAFVSSYRSRASRWDGVAHWSELIAAVGVLADGAPPTIVVTPSFDGAPSPDHPAVLDVVSPSPDVLGAMAVVLRKEPDGTLTHVGLAGLTPLAPDAHGTLTWDGRLHALVSPDGAEPVSSRLWLFGEANPTAPAPSALLAIPGLVVAPGAPDRPAQALFARGTSDVASIVVSFDGFARAVAPGDVAGLVPGASFVPLLDTGTTGKAVDKAPGTPIPLPSDGALSHALIAAPPGAYAIAVIVQDVWRNVSFTVVDVP
jgi:hypothetical protein